jgi:hypothetical protein
MLFLIEYDRNRGHIVKMSVFDNSDRQKAEDSRLEIELALNRQGVEHEVVILHAATEETLRRTHRRYFEELNELAKFPHDVGE